MSRNYQERQQMIEDMYSSTDATREECEHWMTNLERARELDASLVPVEVEIGLPPSIDYFGDWFDQQAEVYGEMSDKAIQGLIDTYLGR